MVQQVTGAGVVVTGAGSGIGAALARRFAAEGARVVVNDVNAEAAAAVAASCRSPAGAVAVPGDAASETSVTALIEAARSALGEIDLYCANAGIARVGGPEAAEADWEDSWQVNVMAHVRAARLLIGPWLERGSGHLICTVSAAGLLAMPGTAPYSVTKHAALAVRRVDGLHLRPPGDHRAGDLPARRTHPDAAGTGRARLQDPRRRRRSSRRR